jgi:23S rRNA pseudouridine1911/1915/1917 synthase
MDQGQRVDQLIAEKEEISRALVKKFKDALRINNSPAKLSQKVKEGDAITFSYEKEITVHHLEPEDIPVPILYEDEYLLVANKPRGMVVHPAKGNWSGTLVNALYSHLQTQNEEDLRPGIVHRLDKETTGVIVIAKDYDTQEKLSKLFRKRRVEKVYHALVEGFMQRTVDEIIEPIGRHSKNRLKFTVDELHGKKAHTRFKLLREAGPVSWLEVNILTGRTHQIRVHLSHLGHPIVGDGLYGSRFREFPMCLIAKKIGFEHPFTKEYCEFEIELPDFFTETLAHFQEKGSK